MNSSKNLKTYHNRVIEVIKDIHSLGLPEETMLTSHFERTQVAGWDIKQMELFNL